MNTTTRWSVKCTACGAPPGAPCVGSKGQLRLSVHIERWQRHLSMNRKKVEKKTTNEYVLQLEPANSWVFRCHDELVTVTARHYPEAWDFAQAKLDELHPDQSSGGWVLKLMSAKYVPV